MTNQPKQIELAKPMADAISNAFREVNNLQAEMQNLHQRLQSAQSIHAGFMKAVIEAAGYTVEDFERCGVWNGEGEDAGKVFLRAQPLAPESNPVPLSETPLKPPKAFLHRRTVSPFSKSARPVAAQ